MPGRHANEISLVARQVRPVRRLRHSRVRAPTTTACSDVRAASRTSGREASMTYAAEEIQLGWTVWASDGKNLGTGVPVDWRVIVAKEGGIRGGKSEVRRS